MLGIVIPAHNEEQCLAECLCAARRAAAHPALKGEAVHIVVVLDSCDDGSAAITAAHPVLCMEVRCRNVGSARATGAEALLALGARWLAFTDADSCVHEDWLVQQLSQNADAVCGTVAVEDWSPHGVHAGGLREHFRRHYQDQEGHRHVHGANIGLTADAYRRAGGFQNLACSEDVALVEALEAVGARIAWTARARVTTSARRLGRASGGFAGYLLQAVSQHLLQPGPEVGGISLPAGT